MSRTNELGQPIGEPVTGWSARPRPGREPMVGRFCRWRRSTPPGTGPTLFEANAPRRGGRDVDLHGLRPVRAARGLSRPGPSGWRRARTRCSTPSSTRQTGKAVGVAAYLRIEPAVGVIEVGHIAYSPLLQRTPAATEAMYLLMRRVFDELGYRRYEWKCDALNAPSRAAADRLGFRFEGIFRQATLYKGRNRDTAWYSVIDSEWPARRAAFEAWLDPANFDRTRAARSARWHGLTARKTHDTSDVHRARHGRRPAGSGRDQGRDPRRARRDRPQLPAGRPPACWRTSGGRMLVHVRLGVPAEAAPAGPGGGQGDRCPMARSPSRWCRAACWCPNGLDDGGRICVVNAAVEVAVDRHSQCPPPAGHLRPLDQHRGAGHGQEHGGEDQEHVGEGHHQGLGADRGGQRLQGGVAGIGAQPLQTLLRGRPAAPGRRRRPR